MLRITGAALTSSEIEWMSVQRGGMLSAPEREIQETADPVWSASWSSLLLSVAGHEVRFKAKSDLLWVF